MGKTENNYKNEFGVLFVIKDTFKNKLCIFNHIFNNEEPILELKKMFEDYRYPDIEQIIKLKTLDNNLKSKN